MPHLKGPPEERVPKRPFNVTMVEDALVFEGLLDDLEVHTIEVSMPRAWASGNIDHCFVKMHTSVGTVQAKRKTFAAAILAVVAAVEALQSLDGRSEERGG
jgi:hypothetical protein